MARILLHGANRWQTAISTQPPCTHLTQSSAERARRERRHPSASTPAKSLSPLTIERNPSEADVPDRFDTLNSVPLS
jgi:hypothetical protein